MSNFERFLFVGFTLTAILSGFVVPLFSFLFGRVTQSFVGGDVRKKVNENVLYLLYLSVAAAFLQSTTTSLAGRARLRRSKTERLKILRRSFDMPMEWHQSHSSPEIVAELVTKAVPTLLDGMYREFPTLLRSATTATLGLAVSFFSDAYLTALILAVVLPSLVCISAVTKFTTRHRVDELDEADEGGNGVVRNALGQIAAVQNLNIQGVFESKYSDVTSIQRRAYSSIRLIRSINDMAVTNLVFCLAYALVVWRGWGRPPGDVITVLFASLNAGYNASLCLPALTGVVDGIAAGKLLETFGCEDGGQSSTDDCSVENEIVAGRIDFKNLTFSYPGGKQKTLDSIDFSVPAGSRVAIVGASGCGKTTLLHLLLKLYPSSSSIFIDGVDLSAWGSRSWYRAICYVCQSTVVFQGTVYDNITCGDSNFKFHDVVEACRLADCLGFIEKLEQQFQTKMSASQLSGGQRQKIGLARAFLKRRPLWLLDEWSSALDNASEQAIGEALGRMPGTMISVAHKVRVIKACDRIVVLQGGRVVGNGTHTELLNDSPVYRQLLEVSEFDTSIVEADSKPSAPLRASVLSRNSVRLSIIPEFVKAKLQKKAPFADSVVADVDTSEFEGDWRVSALAIFCSLILGTQFPGYAVVLSGCVGSFVQGESVVRYSVAYVGIGLLALFLMSFRFACQEWLAGLWDQNVRNRIFRDSLSLPLEWHVANPWTAVLLLLKQMRGLSAVVVSGRPKTAKLFSSVISSLVVAFVSCPKLAAVVMATLPLHVGPRLLETAIESSTKNDFVETIDGSNGVSIQAMKDIHSVITLCYDSRLLETVSFDLERLEARGSRTETLRGIVQGFANFVVLNTVGVALWFGTGLILENEASIVAMFRSFLAAYFLLCYDLVELPEILRLRAIGMESISRVSDLLLVAKEQRGNQAATTRLLAVNGSIAFRDVTFGYPQSGRLVLKSFDLAIPAKSSLALVGASGHGKSSVIQLLLGHYVPQDGQILLDGVDLTKLSRSYVRSICSIVSQSPAIFDATVIENLLYGADGNPNMEDVKAACIAAGIDEVISQLPGGYDCHIRDDRLSGGQRARLALARALLSPRPVTVLDEPTAALDKESECHISRALDQLVSRKGGTIVMVAHRLSTVVRFDNIAAIYRGRVLEQGRHDELLEKGGYYAHLWSLQG